MSEQTANLCTTDACESLRARLAKYEDAEGRPLQSDGVDDRAAFEGRFSKVYDLDFDEETEEYKDPGDQALWYGWQARAALAQSERVAEGHVLVPLDIAHDLLDESARHVTWAAQRALRELIDAAPSVGSHGGDV